ncbi:MAG: winged helix-turn-helix transcriptional regulator [Ktedonobacteraceae bacterium]|nr:winged helix-turn-helix transcriptional regulator [Ktedonobacteraceae bacterium]MBO0789419.1 winged helix-turn-helix transcriptional regulator [Ktedonobacteraceae bacterium]
MNKNIRDFVDRVGQFYSRQYNVPPVTGRLLGYLAVCEPMEQSIAGLAEALLASRSAITNAVNTLERYHLVRRERHAGSRVDLISIDTTGLENNGFAPALYAQQAALAHEGLALLEDAPPARRQALEEIATFAEFLVERIPALLEEWQAKKRTLQQTNKP